MAHSTSTPALQPSRRLQSIVEQSLALTLRRFEPQKLRAEQLAVSLVDPRDPRRLSLGHHRGQVPIYPASVVKLFYLVAAHQWLQDGRLNLAPELRRALRDMIVESSNDATHYVVDLLTGTTSGPELPPEPMRRWIRRRNVINRYFAACGFSDLNLNQKTWAEGPYGRDYVFTRHPDGGRNALTTDTTARLLAAIMLDQAVSPQRSRAMRKLLHREPFSPQGAPNDQAHGFIGSALRPGTALWSKAGWTTRVRHDAACVELPDSSRFILVIFTTFHSSEKKLIPALARQVLDRLTLQAGTTEDPHR